jgi:hypothetical protein
LVRCVYFLFYFWFLPPVESGSGGIKWFKSPPDRSCGDRTVISLPSSASITEPTNIGVTKELREEREESTHVNILKDNITLTSFFCGNHKMVDVNNSEDLFIPFFSLNFFNKKFFPSQNCKIDDQMRLTSLPNPTHVIYLGSSRAFFIFIFFISFLSFL